MGPRLWTPDYSWVQDFWTDVLHDDVERVWQVNGLMEGDLWLRDAFALGLVRERLHERRARVDYQYVRAWAQEPGVDLSETSKHDMLFLGRPKAFYSSRYHRFAHRLGTGLKGQFIDGSDGRLGKSVAYEGRVFTRADFDEDPKHPRCYLDYAILVCRDVELGDEIRRMVGIHGLSSLGTLLLTLVLADDRRRQELMRQLQELAPWDPRFASVESIEVCVRVEVERREDLGNLLNDPHFTFRVEALVLGKKQFVREERVELVLHPDAAGRRGGRVSVEGVGDVSLTATRFRLLQLLVEKQAVTAEDLCRQLDLVTDGATQADMKKAKGRLAKMVFDVNLAFAKVPAFQHVHPIQSRERKYALTGARGVVR